MMHGSTKERNWPLSLILLCVYIYIHIKQMRLVVYGKTKLFPADTKQYIQTLLVGNMRSIGFIIPRTRFYCEPDINVIFEF